MVIAKPSNWLSEPETVTILNTATLSDTINMAGRHPVGVFMSAAWTTAAMEFDIQYEASGTWYNVYDDAEALYDIAVPVAGKYMQINPRLFRGARYLRAVSSTAQLADRSLIMMFAEPEKNF